MNDNLIERLSDRAEFLRVIGNDDIAKLLDEARAAIERHNVPAGWMLVPIEPSEAMTDATYAGQHCSDIWRDMIAAAPQLEPVQEQCPECDGTGTVAGSQAHFPCPICTSPQEAQPQPVQPEGPMAETVEQAARDVAKCLNERDGQGLDLRHVAMLVHYAQQPVQEPVAWIEREWGGSGLKHLHFERREPSVRDEVMNPVWTPLYTSPQAQPLSDGAIIDMANKALPGWERKDNDLAYLQVARAIEQAHGITKGTT